MYILFKIYIETYNKMIGFIEILKRHKIFLRQFLTFRNNYILNKNYLTLN